MMKKIIFRSVDPSKYEVCQAMPPGAIEEQGLSATGLGITIDDILGWSGRPVMTETSLPPLSFPEIEFALCAAEVSWCEFTLDVKCKNVAPSEIVKILEGSATDIPSNHRFEVLETFEPLVKSEVKSFIETADKGGFFLGPLRVAVRLRLTDGSLCTLPTSRLLVTNDSPLKVGIIGAAIAGDSAIVRCAVLAQPARLVWRIRDRGSFGESVAGVEFLATRPASVWNSSADVRLAGGIESPKTAAGTLGADGRLTDVYPERSARRGTVTTRGWSFYGTLSPVGETSAEERWYKIGSLSGLPPVDETWAVLAIPITSTLSALFSGKGETLDFISLSFPVSALTADFAGRTVAVRPRLSLPSPLFNPTQLPTGYDSEGNRTGFDVTGVFVRFANGSVSAARLGSGVKIIDPGSGWLTEWTYPAIGARSVAISYIAGDGEERVVGFSLSDDPESGSSKSVGVLREFNPGEIISLKTSALSAETFVVFDPSLFLDFEAGGPQLSCGVHRLRMEGSGIAGVARVLPSVSAEGYPSLYLMASDGIRALKWISSGGWRPERLLSGVGCNNPEGIVETGDSVTVLTESGILRLSGTAVIEVSLPGAGNTPLSVGSLPGASELIGIVSQPKDLDTLFSNGSLRYDPVSRYLALIVSKDRYVYDLSRGRWLTVGGSESGSDWMLTYPMDTARMRFRSIDFFGCSMTEDPVVALYVSDTLSGWRLVRASRLFRGRFGPILGTPARFLRLLIVGPRPEGCCLNV